MLAQVQRSRAANPDPCSAVQQGWEREQLINLAPLFPHLQGKEDKNIRL